MTNKNSTLLVGSLTPLQILQIPHQCLLRADAENEHMHLRECIINTCYKFPILKSKEKKLCIVFKAQIIRKLYTV